MAICFFKIVYGNSTSLSTFYTSGLSLDCFDKSLGALRVSGYPNSLFSGRIYAPRIEATGYSCGEDISCGVAWQVVSDVESPASTLSGPYEVWGFNDQYPSGYSLSDPMFPPDGTSGLCMGACVCVGDISAWPYYVSSIGKLQYTAGFWNSIYSSSGGLFARDICSSNWGTLMLPGTLISPSLWYQVNTSSMTNSSQINKNMAISSSSNEGQDLMTAWYDDNVNSILYKYSTPDVMAFRPKGVLNPRISKGISLSENAVEHMLRVNGAVPYANYIIRDENATILKMGNLAGGNTIDVSTLPEGNYNLRISISSKSQNLNFTKHL